MVLSWKKIDNFLGDGSKMGVAAPSEGVHVSQGLVYK